MTFTSVADAFAQIGDFRLVPLDRILHPLIKQVLTEQGKAKYRKLDFVHLSFQGSWDERRRESVASKLLPL